MRIVLVHNRYRSNSPGGEDVVVDREAALLEAAGHRVERFERHNDEIERRSRASRAVLPAQVVWSDGDRRRLARLLAAFDADVAHVHNIFPLLSSSVLHAARAARVPAVATLHNYRLVCAGGTLFRDGAACHDCVGRAPLAGVRHGCYQGSSLATAPVALAMAVHARTWRSSVSAYIFLSARQRDVVARAGLPAERLFVKPNFVDGTAVPEVEPQPIAVYAGRFSDAKGVPVLLRAWDVFTARRGRARRLRLVIAGAGPLEADVRAWAAGRPDVEVRGHLPRDECAALVASARVVLVPSTWEETFGLVVVEAMAAGVPVVATAHGSFPELVTDGVDGALVPPGDPAAMARVLERVDRRPGRWRSMGAAGRATYEARYTPERNLARLEEIYRWAVQHPVWAAGAAPAAVDGRRDHPLVTPVRHVGNGPMTGGHDTAVTGASALSSAGHALPHERS